MTLDDEAKDSIIKLSKGDMRRVVNILQSANMIVSNEIINEEHIHQITGTPTKQHLYRIFEILLNDILINAITKIYMIIKEYSLSLADIITGI